MIKYETQLLQPPSLKRQQFSSRLSSLYRSGERSLDIDTSDCLLKEELQGAKVELNLDLRAIWTHRAKPEVQELVRARYEILRLRMTRINPAYYNSALYLGALFEGILNGESSHKYLHSLTIYLSEWVDAKEMQESLENILD